MNRISHNKQKKIKPQSYAFLSTNFVKKQFLTVKYRDNINLQLKFFALPNSKTATNKKRNLMFCGYLRPQKYRNFRPQKAEKQQFFSKSQKTTNTPNSKKLLLLGKEAIRKTERFWD